MSRNSGFALVLIALGALILMSRLHLGSIMGYVFPIVLIAIGYYGIRRGSKIGWIAALIGIIILIGKLSWLIMIILAVAMVVLGFSLLTRSKKKY
jgi:lia operon protein LiaI